MKKKYIAMVALACWLAVTGWLGSMVVAKPAVFFKGNDAVESPEAAQLRAAIQRNQLLLEVAGKLRPPQPVMNGTELIAIPDTSASESASSSAGDSSVDNSTSAYTPSTLSMVIKANGRTSAILDGAAVRVGSRLENGGRVVAIGSDWIRVIGSDGAAQTLKLRNISQSLSGGAQP